MGTVEKLEEDLTAEGVEPGETVKVTVTVNRGFRVEEVNVGEEVFADCFYVHDLMVHKTSAFPKGFLKEHPSGLTAMLWHRASLMGDVRYLEKVGRGVKGFPLAPMVCPSGGKIWVVVFNASEVPRTFRAELWGRFAKQGGRS